MHLELRGEEAGNRCKAGREDDAHNKSQQHAKRCRHAGEIKNMSEHGTGVDSLVHDNCRCNHAHADHTADRKVGTCQKDQSRNAKSKEHAGRCLLQDVQDVVHREQGGMLDDRGDDAQHNENQDNDNVKSVL